MNLADPSGLQYVAIKLEEWGGGKVEVKNLSTNEMLSSNTSQHNKEVANDVALGIQVTTTIISAGTVSQNSPVSAVANVVVASEISNGINKKIYDEVDADSCTITSDTYSKENRYLTRKERLAYAKQQTGSETYDKTAKMYYAEYSVHMYGWFILGWAYEKNIPIISDYAESTRDAYVVPGQEDSRLVVRIVTKILAFLGV